MKYTDKNFKDSKGLKDFDDGVIHVGSTMPVLVNITPRGSMEGRWLPLSLYIDEVRSEVCYYIGNHNNPPVLVRPHSQIYRSFDGLIKGVVKELNGEAGVRIFSVPVTVTGVKAKLGSAEFVAGII